MVDFLLKTDVLDMIWRNIIDKVEKTYGRLPLSNESSLVKAQMWDWFWEEYCKVEEMERPIRIMRYQLNKTEGKN